MFYFYFFICFLLQLKQVLSYSIFNNLKPILKVFLTKNLLCVFTYLILSWKSFFFFARKKQNSVKKSMLRLETVFLYITNEAMFLFTQKIYIQQNAHQRQADWEGHGSEERGPDFVGEPAVLQDQDSQSQEVHAGGRRKRRSLFVYWYLFYY